MDRRALIVGTPVSSPAARRRDADGGEDVSSRPRDVGNPSQNAATLQALEDGAARR